MNASEALATWPDVALATWPDVAARAMGGSVVATNDELFAAADNLVNNGPAMHDPGLFGTRGKVYDGWETRRRRGEARLAAQDWVVVRLGVPAVVRAVVVDTAFFTGNFPTHASLDAATLLGYPSADEVLAAGWTTLLPPVELVGDAPNAFAVEAPERLTTHVRLRIHPDGGVARLRVHGEVVPDPRFLGGRIDLAATAVGGRITGCSNGFYAAPSNVLAPGRARVMSDGWETARRRDDGNDWLTVALAAPAQIHDVVIDTSRFVGNAPGAAMVTDASSGVQLLARTRLQPDTEHRFLVADTSGTPDTPESDEVRLDVYPDGGLSRLRVHGSVAPAARAALTHRWLGLLPSDVARSLDRSTFFA